MTGSVSHAPVARDWWCSHKSFRHSSRRAFSMTRAEAAESSVNVQPGSDWPGWRLRNSSRACCRAPPSIPSRRAAFRTVQVQDFLASMYKLLKRWEASVSSLSMASSRARFSGGRSAPLSRKLCMLSSIYRFCSGLRWVCRRRSSAVFRTFHRAWSFVTEERKADTRGATESMALRSSALSHRLFRT